MALSKTFAFAYMRAVLIFTFLGMALNIVSWGIGGPWINPAIIVFVAAVWPGLALLIT